MKLLKVRMVFAAILMWLCAFPVAADTARITAFIEATRVTGDGTFGGCMASLSKDPAEVLPACKSSWVTFSCDGTYTDPVLAYRMLDQAQLALATGMKVLVFVDDSKMHNGYCLASRINVIAE